MDYPENPLSKMSITITSITKTSTSDLIMTEIDNIFKIFKIIFTLIF